MSVVPMKVKDRYNIRIDNDTFEMKLPDEIADQFDVLIEQHGIPCDIPEGAYRKEVVPVKNRYGQIVGQEVTLRQNGNTDADAFLANRRRRKDEAAQKEAMRAANQGHVPAYADPNMAPAYLNKG